jgi:hypothetical protein
MLRAWEAESARRVDTFKFQASPVANFKICAPHCVLAVKVI